MSLKVSAEYKDYTVTWSDFDKSFIISFDGSDVKRGVKTLEDCEKWIDAKCKQKFKRIPVFISKRWGKGGLVEGEATSAIDHEYVWVVDKNGERNKARASDVWLITPENTNYLAQVRTIESEMERLAIEKKDIQAKAERLTVEMMVEK